MNGDGDAQRVLRLREAAELTGHSLASLRKRADRGSLAVVQRDGVRLMPHTELEREVERLRRELAQHRRLVDIAVAPEVVGERGYFTVEKKTELARLSFRRSL